MHDIFPMDSFPWGFFYFILNTEKRWISCGLKKI